MQIIEIQMDSEAGRELREVLADPHTYRIRLSPNGVGSVKIKANEHTWSPPLFTSTRPVTELEDLLTDAEDAS